MLVSAAAEILNHSRPTHPQIVLSNWKTRRIFDTLTRLTRPVERLDLLGQRFCFLWRMGVYGDAAFLCQSLRHFHLVNLRSAPCALRFRSDTVRQTEVAGLLESHKGWVDGHMVSSGQ